MKVKLAITQSLTNQHGLLHMYVYVQTQLQMDSYLCTYIHAPIRHVHLQELITNLAGIILSNTHQPNKDVNFIREHALFVHKCA